MDNNHLLPGHVDRQDPTTFVFFHIPKTAGRTLNSILRRQYPSDLIYWVNRPPTAAERVHRFQELPEAERARYRAITGHVHLEFADSIPNPVSYVTMLRHPVDRVISQYHHIATHPKHPKYDAIKGGNVDLAEAVSTGLFSLTDNGQVRGLCGIEQLKVGHGQCTVAMLEAAKRNLTERFVVAGITERFDEMIQLLAHYFGWRKLYYVRRGVASKRPTKDRLPDETARVLRDCNELDALLYDFAVARLDATIKEFGSAFGRKVRRFTRVNETRARIRGWKARLNG